MTGTDVPDPADDFEVALFRQARAGLEIYDLDLRVLRSNAAALAMRGQPEEEVVGAELKSLDTGIPVWPIMSEVVRDGHPVLDQRVPARPSDDPHHRHVYAVSGFLLCGGDRAIGAAAMVHDITEPVRKQNELDLLNVARSQIGTSLDALRTAQELADMAVPRFADAVAVDLLESVLSGDAPIGPVSSRLPMRRAAFRAIDGGYGAYPVGSASSFAFPTPYTQALADLRPRLVNSVRPADGWLDHDQLRAEFFSRAGVHSLIVAPLTVHGLLLGLVSFYRKESRSETFDEEDLTLASQLTACTALCVDNARRFTRERTVNTALQRSLLPRTPPEVSAVEPAHCYLPGRYGAHWYDVLDLSSCRVGLVIGYVPGEDLQASTAMGRLRTAVSTLAEMDLPPDELLAHLDDAAQRLGREQDDDPVTLHRGRPPFSATCAYLVYDPVTRQCTAASAGHPAPLITSPEGVVSRLGVPVGPALGRGTPYESSTTELGVGSLLSLYSDGSADRHPAEADERLRRLWETLADVAARPTDICDAASYKVLRTIPQDGAALLVARTRHLDPGHVVDWTFPPQPASVGEARRAARKWLSRWGLEEEAAVMELVVSELTTNVITHAEGPIRLRLILDRTLTIEVSDDADTAPHLRHARVQDEGGRGLFLVASLAGRWGTRYGENGKTIWAEQKLVEP
ncbi:SpoIIE family protein phosphatase [Streptomyces sp. NPDC089424]|uniref:ATP-binding SpoIIE family protein phosphatase n=1 Tax=Streptomyces sp. NPDC089424 TaxID=3365917 RepID=UPI0037F919E4